MAFFLKGTLKEFKHCELLERLGWLAHFFFFFIPQVNTHRGMFIHCHAQVEGGDVVFVRGGEMRGRVLACSSLLVFLHLAGE